MTGTARIVTGSGADRVPPALRKVLETDVRLTKAFIDGVSKAAPQTTSPSFISYMKALEISCHGVPWFAGVLIFVYLFRGLGAREVEINLLLALIYDVMAVSFVKAVTRRNRPVGNKTDEMFFTKGPDKFSFPSGHATRAVLVALFFTQYAIPDMNFLFQVTLYVWAASVCVSRVLMRRHHLLDVTAGIFIGLLEFLLSGALWVGPEASKAIGDWMASSAEDEAAY